MKTFFVMILGAVLFSLGCGNPNYGINGGGNTSIKKNVAKQDLPSGMDGMKCSFSTASSDAGIVTEVNSLCRQIDNTQLTYTVCNVAWSTAQNVVSVTKETYAAPITIPQGAQPTKSQSYVGRSPGETPDAALSYIKTQFPKDCQAPEQNLKLSVPAPVSQGV